MPAHVKSVRRKLHFWKRSSGSFKSARNCWFLKQRLERSHSAQRAFNTKKLTTKFSTTEELEGRVTTKHHTALLYSHIKTANKVHSHLSMQQLKSSCAVLARPFFIDLKYCKAVKTEQYGISHLGLKAAFSDGRALIYLPTCGTCRLELRPGFNARWLSHQLPVCLKSPYCCTDAPRQWLKPVQLFCARERFSVKQGLQSSVVPNWSIWDFVARTTDVRNFDPKGQDSNLFPKMFLMVLVLRLSRLGADLVWDSFWSCAWVWRGFLSCTFALRCHLFSNCAKHLQVFSSMPRSAFPQHTESQQWPVACQIYGLRVYGPINESVIRQTNTSACPIATRLHDMVNCS